MPLSIRLLAGALVVAASAAAAQLPADPTALLAAQAEAMRRFAMLDGAWRGPATIVMPDGARRTFIQTERIGPFLAGSVRVIEGRGYAEDGRVTFNALGILSYDVDKRAYSMRSHAHGRVGDFAMQPTADGYTWQIPYGPNATLRYAAKIEGDELVEVGDLHVVGREPVRTFEMRLRRLGDSDWPGGGAVPPK